MIAEVKKLKALISSADYGTDRLKCRVLSGRLEITCSDITYEIHSCHYFRIRQFEIPLKELKEFVCACSEINQAEVNIEENRLILTGKTEFITVTARIYIIGNKVRLSNKNIKSKDSVSKNLERPIAMRAW